MLHRGPWTLAVCVVLLPALRQLIGSQQEQRLERRGGGEQRGDGEGGWRRGDGGTDCIDLYLACRHLETLSAAVAMIVHRFSDSIQTCKCEFQGTHCS